jgi:hypothetical protein
MSEQSKSELSKSEQSNATQDASLDSQAKGSDGTAAVEAPTVGHGRPPVDTRWKKGGRSPNPRGRPRKDESLLPDLRKLFERALNKKVAVPRGDREVLMTRLQMGIEQLLNQLAKGDRHARQDFMKYAPALGIDLLATPKQAIEDALEPSRQAILDSYVARRSGAGNVAPAQPVLAPPELLDDDIAADDSGEPEATLPFPSKAEIKSTPAPEPSRKEKQAAPKLDQASLGRGSPPPGGFSLTTGKWS